MHILPCFCCMAGQSGVGRCALLSAATGLTLQTGEISRKISRGKHTTRHNLPLLAGLPRIVALGFPVLLGASRKGFIGALDGGAAADARLGGSIAAALVGASAGVAAVRVHDVRETVQALAVQTAIAHAGARSL